MCVRECVTTACACDKPVVVVVLWGTWGPVLLISHLSGLAAQTHHNHSSLTPPPFPLLIPLYPSRSPMYPPPLQCFQTPKTVPGCIHNVYLPQLFSIKTSGLSLKSSFPPSLMPLCLKAADTFPICLLEFWKFELCNTEERKEGRMMRAWWEGKCLPERQDDLPINQCHTPSPWHVNREGLGYQTHWGSQNELMQLISDVFSTCLPLAGRNWKSCLARKRECNLDYADWMIWPHERLPLLLPRPLFSFLHPSLPSFLL